MKYQSIVDAVSNEHLNASNHCSILKSQIDELTKTLSDDEILMVYTMFGVHKYIIITEIDFSNPYLIHFYGYDNESPVIFTQHISQINVLMKIVKKSVKQNFEKPFIGFRA